MTIVKLSGWKFGALCAFMVGAVGLAIYPIIISPMLDPSPYKQAQRTTRKNIKQEEVQPGGMKVWTDPFDRKKAKEGEAISSSS